MKILHAWFVAFGVCFLASELVAQYTLEYSTNGSVITLTAYSGTPVNITIPGFVTSIGESAFQNCDSLTSANVSEGSTGIEEYAFWGCSSLSNVTIGNSVTNIGLEAFSYCTNLMSISVSSSNPAFSSVNGVLFNKDQTTLLQYPCGINGRYTIPESVTSIELLAFAYSTGLTSITIGSAVTNIAEFAFYDCTNLTGALFEGNAPMVGPDVFYAPQSPGLADPTTLYYLPGTAGWTVFSTEDNMPTVLWNPVIRTGSLGFQNNQFNFTITGTPNIPIQIATTTDLASGTWIPLQTCTLTNGLIQFGDAGASNYPSRFYTVQFP